MAYIPKEGQFTLFHNDKKNKDSQPDMTGNGMLNGKNMRIAAWKKSGQQGKDYLSISISEFQERGQKQAGDIDGRPQESIPTYGQAYENDFNDVPF